MPQLNIQSIGHVAASMNSTVPEVRSRAAALGITPSASVNGVDYYDSAAATMIRRASGQRAAFDKPSPAVLAAALCRRAGLRVDQIPTGPCMDEDLRRDVQRELAEQADELKFPNRNVMLGVARNCLEAETGEWTNLDDPELLQRAMSTATFTNVFTTAAAGVVGVAFADAPDTTRTWTRDVSARDFKEHADVELGPDASGLRRIGRGQQAPPAEMIDRGETWRIARFGKMFKIDEMDLLDDNLDALAEVPKALAEEARQLRPDLVYSLLLGNPTLGEDSTALFHANHKNLAIAALADTSLGAGIAAVMEQRLNSRPLNLSPTALIVPPALVRPARKLLADTDGQENAEDLRVFGEARIGAEGVRSPLTDEELTGSATNWFLAAPGRSINVATLGDGPQIRSYPLTQGEWGLGFDVKLDIGAYVADFRGLYKSSGTT